MFNIGIVEDDEIIRDLIKNIIRKVLFEEPIDYRIYQYESSEAFLDDSNKVNIHLLLLDIELPKMSGIDLAKNLNSNLDGMIIFFITSHDIYMKNAFGLNIHRYILKKELSERFPNELLDIISLYNNHLAKKFNTPEGFINIRMDQIKYIEYRGRNPHLITSTDEEFKLSAGSLKSLYRYLSHDKFAHINNRYIVNMDYIYEFTSKGVRIHNEEPIFNVSKRKYKEILNQYQSYLMKGDILK